MKCSNCRQNEATVNYLQIINGEKTELFLCKSCAEEFGIDNLDITIPMDFSSFISDFFDNFNEHELLSALTESKVQKCRNCGLSYEEFVKTGKLGCIDCYDVFKDRIDLITKNIQGSSEHKGRGCKSNLSSDENSSKSSEKNKEEIMNQYKNVSTDESDINKKIFNQDAKQSLNKNEKIEILKMKLKAAIKDERYEDAAQIRDKIKELEN